jgi:hypothetical protein
MSYRRIQGLGSTAPSQTSNRHASAKAMFSATTEPGIVKANNHERRTLCALAWRWWSEKARG